MSMTWKWIFTAVVLTPGILGVALGAWAGVKPEDKLLAALIAGSGGLLLGSITSIWLEWMFLAEGAR